MWSGASVAHTAPVQEDLGSILTQTQMALLHLSAPIFQTTDFKKVHSFVILWRQVEINNIIIINLKSK